MADDDLARLQSESSFEDESFDDLDLGGVNLVGKEFARCTFRGTKLSDTAWANTVLEDCDFESCDLSNVRLAGATLRTVHFRACKLVGVSWMGLSASPSVSFTDCAMRYQAFIGLLLRSTPFTRCSLVESAFQEVDLSRATFVDCDLTRATFDRCVLAGTDFSAAIGVVFDAAKNRAKGAKISADTASAMASALGLIVSGYTPAKR